MNRKLISMSRRYASALRKHLKQGPRASLQTARGLGRQAVASGLETLDVAMIHEKALEALEAASSRDGIIERAEIFFAEAITPIEKTHDAALQAKRRLSQLNKTLDRRTVDLTATNRSLKQRIAQRKTVEKALRKSAEHGRKLLEESRQLQKHLQQLTHRILSAQEDKRKTISRDLRDEIAQTLLGINARLFSLKKVNVVSAMGFKKEIARTQQIVDISVRNIEQFARKFDKQNET